MFVTVLFFSGHCSLKKKTADNKPEPLQVKTHIASASRYTNFIKTGATLAVKKKANISAPREEVITRMYAAEGEPVTKGQLLFVLDTQTLRLKKEQLLAVKDEAAKELEMARAELREAVRNCEKKYYSLQKEQTELNLKKINFSNTKRILSNQAAVYKAGGLAREKLLQQQLQYYNELKNLEKDLAQHRINSIGYRDQDLVKAGHPIPAAPEEKIKLLCRLNTEPEKAAVDSAHIKVVNAASRIASVNHLINKSYVRSPLTGVVARKNYDTGEKCSRSQPVYTIINPDTLYVSAALPEERVPVIKKGQPLHFKHTSFPAQSFFSSISVISPLLEQQSRNFYIKGKVNNPGHILKAGMYVSLKILINTNARDILVPEKYLYQRQDQSARIFCAEQGKAVSREVTVKHYQGSLFIVQSGIKAGDKLIYSLNRVPHENDIIKSQPEQLAATEDRL